MVLFDPNAAALPDSGIFGLSCTEEEASVVCLPVPWEVTTSYGGGTSEGPAAMLAASRQMDLFDLEVERPYAAGIVMLAESASIRALNVRAKAEAQKIIQAGGVAEKNAEMQAALHFVNTAGATLNEYVRHETLRLLNAKKIPAIIGGDHSVPLGAFQAVAEKHTEFGILHFDAHSDTRNAYQGFDFSHASIMHNALELVPQLAVLVQVGIRDFCEEEYIYTHVAQKKRVHVNFDTELAKQKMEGVAWSRLCEKIISPLPRNVWISFDIDGLDPAFCPHTGTPVPGGLSFSESVYLIFALARSGRKIIGFDLNEVAPDPSGQNEWDANVGARLLYKIFAATLASQQRVKFRG